MIPKALLMVLTITAIKIHCLKTAGAHFLLLQWLIEVLLKAENSKHGQRPPSVSVSKGFGLEEEDAGWLGGEMSPCFLLWLLLELMSNYIQSPCTRGVIQRLNLVPPLSRAQC